MLMSKTFWTEFKDYVWITVGLLLYTFGWTVFLLPYHIVTGGVTGLSAIIFYATNIPISYSYFLINLVLLLAALKILGLKFMVKTIYAIGVLSLLLAAAQWVITQPNGQMYKILGEGQQFMSLVIGCMFTGTSLAIVFLHNGSTGGTDIIAACVNKYKNISLGRVLIFVDFLIIGSCLFIPQFGDPLQRVHMTVFGLCTMVVENFMLDYVFNARRESVQFMIFSLKYQEIANAIGTQLEHGVTILDGHGWYTGKERKVLCILAKKNESQYIFRLIKMIDPQAFVSQSSVIGVYGEGFDPIKVSLPKKDKKKK
ncbi:MAG: YitT family protein [Prevotella sp.]|nr:YitT family protein [Prevotella sp.]